MIRITIEGAHEDVARILERNLNNYGAVTTLVGTDPNGARPFTTEVSSIMRREFTGRQTEIHVVVPRVD